MDVIKIESSSKTPAVHFDAEAGHIEIRGRSIPENSLEFYKPLVDWLDAYAKSAKPVTNVNIQLEYFNTSSSKCILDVFKRLESIHNGGASQITINWHYEQDDEDMLEAGEDYQAIINVPFKMVEIENK